jgi:hypothetical protein
MKPTYQIKPLSAASTYLPINLTSVSSSSPNVIHTASATDFDELWLEAYNYSVEDTLLTLCLGGTAAYQLLSQVIPAGRGLIPILRGNKVSSGIVISAFTSSANKISLTGYVHRIIFI